VEAFREEEEYKKTFKNLKKKDNYNSSDLNVITFSDTIILSLSNSVLIFHG
jgi:hypothetical protein